MKKARGCLALLLVLALLTSTGSSLAADNNFYLIPDSDSRYLTEGELWGWQYEALGYIYNEIFARHGRAFRTGEKYDAYFSSQAWYQVNPNYRYGLLNKIEASNERLVHDVLIDMRAQKTTNPTGKALPKGNSAGRYSDLMYFSIYSLKPNQKLAVYTGPGTEYFRAANGKAAVSTNDVVRFAGVEIGWALIEYTISKSASRIGYIDLAELRDDLVLDELLFSYEECTVTKRCQLTDDPDNSRTALMTLDAGATVYMLTMYSSGKRDWAYVQYYTSSGLVRGFIPLDCVSGGVG